MRGTHVVPGGTVLLRACVIGVLVLGALPASAAAAGLKASARARTVYLPIAMYHYVEDVRNPKDTLRVRLSVSPSLLEEQLRELQQMHVRTVFMSQVPSLLTARVASGAAVALTFDDGYEDFYTNVFPLLREYGARATIYVIVGKIGASGYLTAAQIEEMLASGAVEVGSHTLTHPDLRLLPPDAAAREIDESKALLEARFGVAVDSFAYPSGKFTRRVIALVRDAGYGTAVATVPGVRQDPSSLLTLRRVEATRAGTGRKISVLLGLKQWLRKASGSPVHVISKK